MTNPIVYVLEFFKDRRNNYTLDHPTETVLTTIREIPKSTGFWGDNDFELKSLTGNRFSIQLVRINAKVSSPRFSSILYAEVKSSSENKTIIETKVKCSTRLYVAFLLSIILGVIYMFNFLCLKQATENLFWGLLMIFVLPSLAIWYGKVSSGTISERFETYLSKAFWR